MGLLYLTTTTTTTTTFMQVIYNYVPETNHVSTLHSVAAVLYLQFVLHVLLLLLLLLLYFSLAVGYYCGLLIQKNIIQHI